MNTKGNSIAIEIGIEIEVQNDGCLLRTIEFVAIQLWTSKTQPPRICLKDIQLNFCPPLLRTHPVRLPFSFWY